MPDPHTEQALRVDDATGRCLLAYARACIAEALDGDPAARPTGGRFETRAATFVTLHRGATLHGCIGMLEARRPLADDVRANALAAAFEDPRNTPLGPRDVAGLGVEISILSQPGRLTFDTEDGAAALLRPGVDGLILRWGAYRGTFLPQVWESLPAPGEFLRQLKRKAGLRSDFWAPDVVLERYTVQKLSDPGAAPDRGRNAPGAAPDRGRNAP